MKEKSEHLVAQLTIGEMVRMMHGVWGLHAILPLTYRLGYYRTRGVRRLGIPTLRFTDGPKGINLNRSTCFPVAMARGASFDPELEERVGTAMGLEARHQGANTVGSTCLNIVRHPGWGRAQETFGADTYHISIMGAAHVRGLARNVMPVVKHYACNSIENSRFRVSVNIEERALREIYLPHFKAAIDAGAAAIMSAYNRVNSTYCGEHRHLLGEILREEWNFDGFVISDFVLGCRSTVPSLKAGLDIEMPLGWYYRRWRIGRALRKGLISRFDLEQSAGRILRAMKRFGLFEPFFPEPKKIVACKEHTDLALEAARKSIVLLKNEVGILPLDIRGIKKIAVIGKHAREAVLGDIASSAVKPPWKISLFEGISEKTGSACEVAHASSLRKAKKIAVTADAVIILISLTWRDEGENIPLRGGDRTKLELPCRYVRMIKEIAGVNPRCIIVLQGGSAICVDEWIALVPGLLMAWYPGMQGGRAIADVLFGDYNPAGRLPLTVPKSTIQLPVFDTKSNDVTYDHWHDYRYFDRMGMEPRYHFGYGLSYTCFSYMGISLNAKSISADRGVTVTIRVKNVGPRDGEEVVQLYVGRNDSKDTLRAKKELKGFRRIFIEQGKEAEVIFTVRAVDLAWYNAEKSRWEVERTNYRVMAGPSSEELPLAVDFIIV